MPQLMLLTPRIEVAKFMLSTCCFDRSLFQRMDMSPSPLF